MLNILFVWKYTEVDICWWMWYIGWWKDEYVNTWLQRINLKTNEMYINVNTDVLNRQLSVLTFLNTKESIFPLVDDSDILLHLNHSTVFPSCFTTLNNFVAPWSYPGCLGSLYLLAKYPSWSILTFHRWIG